MKFTSLKNEHGKNFNKEDIKKTQSELNMVNKMKSTLEAIISRLEEAAKWISHLQDRIMEGTQAEQQKERKIKNI